MIFDVRLRERSTWLLVAAALAGAWLMAAPATLEYGDPARTNAHIAGPLAVSFAVIATWEILRGLRLVNVAIGAWLVVSPWLLRYDDTITIFSDTLAGALLIVTAMLAGSTVGRFGGGWSALAKRRSHDIR